MTTFDASTTPAGTPVTRATPTLGRAAGRGAVVVLAVVAVFALVGLGAGWLWHQLWTAPQGESYQGVWYVARGRTVSTDETALGQVFGGTGLFVLIGLGGGAILGVLAALVVRRDELAAVVGVVLGSAAAAALCHLVGVHLGPPDPAAVAAHAKDFTVIPDRLMVSGKAPYVMWSLGAAVGLGITYLVSSASRSTAAIDGDPTWRTGNPQGSPGVPPGRPPF